MSERIVTLEDGLRVQIDVDPRFEQQVSSEGGKIGTSFEKIQPTLRYICRQFNATWRELNKEMSIEQAEVQLDLGFEASGNLFVTSGKAKSNLSVKLIFGPRAGVDTGPKTEPESD